MFRGMHNRPQSHFAGFAGMGEDVEIVRVEVYAQSGDVDSSRVREIQTMLNAVLQINLQPDGDYGPLTARAVAEWKSLSGFGDDGNVVYVVDFEDLRAEYQARGGFNEATGGNGTTGRNNRNNPKPDEKGLATRFYEWLEKNKIDKTIGQVAVVGIGVYAISKLNAKK